MQYITQRINYEGLVQYHLKLMIYVVNSRLHHSWKKDSGKDKHGKWKLEIELETLFTAFNNGVEKTFTLNLHNLNSQTEDIAYLSPACTWVAVLYCQRKSNEANSTLRPWGWLAVNLYMWKYTWLKNENFYRLKHILFEGFCQVS